MYYNQEMNDLEKLLKSIIESSRLADGNPEDPCLISDVTKFISKFNSNVETTLAIIRYVVILDLSEENMIWLYNSLPVFTTHGYITPKQCDIISDLINRLLSKYE